MFQRFFFREKGRENLFEIEKSLNFVVHFESFEFYVKNNDNDELNNFKFNRKSQ